MGDQADGEADDGFVDVVASFPADAQASEAVEPGDRALDDLAEDAQAGAARLASPRGHGAVASLPEQAAVLVVVVAAVGQQCVGATAESADLARDGGNLVGPAPAVCPQLSSDPASAATTRSTTTVHPTRSTAATDGFPYPDIRAERPTAS